MAKKLYEEASVQDIAVAIREKTGGAETYKIAQMGNAVRGITGAEAVAWHQCPEAVRNYLANVTYDPSDYSTSQIANYAPATAVVSNYRPIGKTLGGKTYYNQVPGIETPFAATGKAGTLKPLDSLRYIQTDAANVRDLGGWACDGGTIKYGLLIRGGKLAAADRAVLVGELGVQHDLDLRGRDGVSQEDEPDMTESPLGSDVRYTRTQQYAWYSLTPVSAWQDYLRCVIDAVTHNEPVYFHCSAGADRTGTLACVIEGLLGMSQSDIDKDYELTCFYSGTDTDNHARRRNESEWQGLIAQIGAKSGTTFRDKCVTFAAELGFTAAEINAFRAAMIDGTPETVTPSISTFTVTNALTGATSDNDATEVAQYQPYEAVISAQSEKAINEVNITMGGVDITAQVWQGTKTELYRKVTLNLDNCSTDNTSWKVIDKQSYGANITADAGYTLEGAAVQITMGGIDVSSYYAGGKIAIPQVTGDISITISAVEAKQVNLFDKSACTINKRFSGGTNEVAANGYYISNYMPVDITKNPCTATWMGAINNTTDKITFYDANKTALGFAYIYTSKVSSGSNPATLFTGSADAGYVNNIGYVWTGTGDAAKASYYDQIAYVRINQKVSNSALTAASEIPDHQFFT